jgi:hypothetical protein
MEAELFPSRQPKITSEGDSGNFGLPGILALRRLVLPGDKPGSWLVSAGTKCRCGHWPSLTGRLPFCPPREGSKSPTGARSRPRACAPCRIIQAGARPISQAPTPKIVAGDAAEPIPHALIEHVIRVKNRFVG